MHIELWAVARGLYATARQMTQRLTVHVEFVARRSRRKIVVQSFFSMVYADEHIAL